MSRLNTVFESLKREGDCVVALKTVPYETHVSFCTMLMRKGTPRRNIPANVVNCIMCPYYSVVSWTRFWEKIHVSTN